MPIVLLALGAAVAAIGLLAIGFGIPINEFGFGNLLITTGTIGLVGGLVLIGMSFCLRELRQIAQALEGRPVPRAVRPAPVEPAPDVRPVPAKSPPSAEPEPAMLGVPSPADAKLRAEEPEEGASPLSPYAPPKSRRGGSEPASEPKAPSEPPKVDLETVTPHPFTWLRPPQPLEQPRRRSLRDPIPPSPLPPMLAPEPAEPAPPEDRKPPPVDQPKEAEPADPNAVTVLKSGVIEGMAYTLYSDGSIDTEMPQGMVRFGTIDELRAYLEKNA